MHDINNAADGGKDYFNFDPRDLDFDCERRAPSRGEAIPPTNLTLYRWYIPTLTASEERDYIRRAKDGEPFAKNQLLRHHHGTVLSIAAKYHGPSFDDRVSAGCVGLAEAINRFDLLRETGLSAYARPWIRKYIQLAVKEWRRRGHSEESRADRWLYDNRKFDPDAHEVSQATGCDMHEAEEALRVRDMYWHGLEHYDTTEAGLFNYDAENNVKPPFVAEDVPPDEVCEGGGIVSDKEWADIVAYRARPSGLPGRRRQKPEPLKPISRALYTSDQAKLYRDAGAQVFLTKRRARANDIVDYYAGRTDEIAARRLKALGRHDYADELVERDQSRPVRNSDKQHTATVGEPTNRKLELAFTARLQSPAQLFGAVLVVLQSATRSRCEKKLHALTARAARRRKPLGHPLSWHDRDVLDRMPSHKRPQNPPVVYEIEPEPELPPLIKRRPSITWEAA